MLWAVLVNGDRYQRKILVPLRHRERIELFLPYLEELARPGSIIVFLLPISHNNFELITDQLLAVHTGLSAGLAGHNDETFSRRISSVERNSFSHCIALRQNGVKILVSVFAGSFSKIVRQYARRQDIDLIIMRGTAGNLLTRAARKLGLFMNVFRAQASPSVLLFHPSSSIGLK